MPDGISLFKFRAQDANNLLNRFFFEVSTLHQVFDWKFEDALRRVATDVLQFIDDPLVEFAMFDEVPNVGNLDHRYPVIF